MGSELYVIAKRDWGAELMAAETEVGNRRAVLLAERMGFVKVGGEHGKVVMERVLGEDVGGG